MPPTRRKTTAPDDLADKKPANASGDLDALRGEVAAEQGGTEQGWAVPVAETIVRVKHYLDWPASADELLIVGRLSRWAEKIIEPADYTTVWVPLDPTNRQVIEFIQNVEKITGIPLVSSAGSQTT